MQIAVTGGTGFVGAHSVCALVDAGHDVVLLARDPDAARATLARLGVHLAADRVVRGDVTDPTAVARLLEGADAVLNAAGVVGVDDRDEDAMWRVNVEAATTVLATAVALGLDPIVHVASYSALSPCADPVMGPESATTGGRSAYGRTKAAGDRVARAFQEQGAPVVTTYPSSVVGPAAGGRAGITASGWAPLLRLGASVTFEGAVPLVDVRDVAAVHAAAMVPGRGPRRYLCGGTMVPFDRVLDLIGEATGTRIRRAPVPRSLLLALGAGADLANRLLPLPPSFSREAAELLTVATPTDDSLVHEELGVTWRPVAESLRDALASPAPVLGVPA